MKLLTMTRSENAGLETVCFDGGSFENGIFIFIKYLPVFTAILHL